MCATCGCGEKEEHGMKKHPGFKAVAAKIKQKENVSQAAANRILAARTRDASPMAKAANERLKRVK